MEKILLTLLTFLIPTQLSYHFWPTFSFIFGIRVDYLSPAIYLTDILMAGVIFLWFLREKNLIALIKKRHIFFLCLLVLVFANLLSAQSPLISLIRWTKILLFFAFGVYLAHAGKLVSFKFLIRTLLISATFFSVIGTAQFLLSRTLGGPLYFLGERDFSVNTPGIALVSIFGKDFMRAYSTFSHPNSLAGYLGAVMILFLFQSGVKKNPLHPLAILPVLVCFILTFSGSAFLGLTAVFLFWTVFKRNKSFWKYFEAFFYFMFFTSLLSPIFFQRLLETDPFFIKEIKERIELSVAAGKIIADNFTTGVGFNNFTPALAKTGGFTSSWSLQPVHNVFLLVFSEMGILGITGLFYLSQKLLKFLEKNARKNLSLIFLFVLITSFFDHYWLTLQQNTLFLAFLLGICFRRKSQTPLC